MTARKKKAAPEAGSVVAYKGFDAQLQCRGFQYAVGKTYKHAGAVVICETGFHACTNPLDVWQYYDLCSDNRYALVELKEPVVEHDGSDTKIASAEITIKAELKLPDFLKYAVQFLLDLCKDVKEGGENVQSASGHYAKLAASGDYAQLAASGDSAQLAASGDYAKLAASDDSAKLAASGDYAQLAASGADSVIASASYRARAKGIAGTWISLAEFDDDGKCIGFATGCVGQDEIPADVWLCARGGKLMRA